MLTKKDYEAIAEIIRRNTDEIDNGDEYCHYQILPHNTTVFELANYFEDNIPQFDRQRFLDACGIS